MRYDNEQSFPDLTTLGESGYSFILNNLGKLVALLALIVAVLVTFTEVTFSKVGSAEFTTSLVVMLVASYLMFFSLEEAGEGEGERSEEFLRANEKYLLKRDMISPDMIDAIREFCSDYRERELEYRRKNYLGERGISPTEYEEYLKGKKPPLKHLAIFRHAERMRAASLTPAVLLSRDKRSTECELENPEKSKIIGMILRLIPSTLCSFFTVSVILTAKDGLDASAVFEGIVKLSALPIIAIKGFQMGYKYATRDKVVWLETKTRVLECFISSLNTNA